MNSVDQIRLSYRLFLGREPHQEEIDPQRNIIHSMPELMEQLLASKEFEDTGAKYRPYIMKVQSIGDYSFDFLCADAIAAAWYGGLADGVQLPEAEWCLARIKEGMTVLDCGAHHGLFSVAFARAVGPRGRVVAWEAWPEAAAVAVWNLELNGCNNAQVQAVALGDRQSSVQFHLSDGTVFSSSLTHSDVVTVPTIRLDDAIPPGSHVDFMKIDVEGSELEVLRGSRRTLSDRPIINLEIHNFLFSDRNNALREIDDILRPLDYCYWVQREADFDQVCCLGKGADLQQLASWENPHLFCEPQ